MARTLSQKIDLLAHQSKGRSEMTIQEIFHLMDPSEELFVAWLLYLPFILCFEVPGFSVIVSLMIIGLGVRIALHKRFWIPSFMRKIKVSGDRFSHLISHMIGLLKGLEKVAHPRGTVYQRHPLLITFNGWMVAMGGLFLLIPMGTVVVPSIGLVFLGISMLEEDILWMFCAYGIFAVHVAHVVTLLSLQPALNS